MSNAARKARKKAGEKAPIKEPKVPTSAYVSKNEAQKKRAESNRAQSRMWDFLMARKGLTPKDLD